MAQLAIKGHSTKGNKVIEILRSLGGINILNCAGLNEESFYYIEKSGMICYCTMPHNRMVFTLEEFLEKYPYKVGDRIIHNKDIALKVVTMYWDDNFNIVRYDVQGVVDKTVTLKGLMTCHLQPYKETMEDRHLNPKANRMDKEFKQEFQNVKEFFMENKQYAALRLDADQDDKLATEVTIDGVKISSPENYLIGKITQVDNSMLVEFVKKETMEQQKEFMDDAILFGAHILKHIDELNQKIANYQYTLEWIFLSLLNKKVEKVLKKDVYLEDEIFHMLEELFEEIENAKKE